MMVIPLARGLLFDRLPLSVPLFAAANVYRGNVKRERKTAKMKTPWQQIRKHCSRKERFEFGKKMEKEKDRRKMAGKERMGYEGESRWRNLSPFFIDEE